MKKLLLFSALLIFACSSDDSSDTNDNNSGLINCNGNPVPSIVYGTQEWTVENACHTTYRDGTPIPQVTSQAEWGSLNTGAWCYVDNDPSKDKLYNWYAVKGIHDNDPNTPNKEFAPEGWHVPTDAEWTTLEEHLIANGYNYDGTTTWNKIAKSMASTTGWDSSTDFGVITEVGAIGNNQSLNNSSGFNALPVGYRDYGLSSTFMFIYEGRLAYFWSSTGTNFATEGGAYNYLLRWYSYNLIRSSYTRKYGFSVRFVRD